MILMHRQNARRCIHHRRANVPRLPHQPVVPPQPPDQHRRHFAIHPPRKNKIINPADRSTLPSPRHICPQSRFPIRRRKIQRRRNINVPPSPSHQKFRPPSRHALNRPQKLIEQNDVRIHIRNNRKRSRRLRLRKQIIQKRRPSIVPSNRRNMPQSKFPSKLRRPNLIAKQNNLRPRRKPRPAGNRIPLNNSDMPVKSLRHGKNRNQEFSLVFRPPRRRFARRTRGRPMRRPRCPWGSLSLTFTSLFLHHSNPQTQISNSRHILDVLQPPPAIHHHPPASTPPSRRRNLQKFPPRRSHNHNLRPRNTLLRRPRKLYRLAQFPPRVGHPRRIKRAHAKSPRSQFPRQQKSHRFLHHIRLRLVSQSKHSRRRASLRMTSHQLRQPNHLRPIERIRSLRQFRRRPQPPRQSRQRPVVPRKARPAITHRSLQIFRPDARIQSQAPP